MTLSIIKFTNSLVILDKYLSPYTALNQSISISEHVGVLQETHRLFLP